MCEIEILFSLEPPFLRGRKAWTRIYNCYSNLGISVRVAKQHKSELIQGEDRYAPHKNTGRCLIEQGFSRKLTFRDKTYSLMQRIVSYECGNTKEWDFSLYSIFIKVLVIFTKGIKVRR